MGNPIEGTPQAHPSKAAPIVPEYTTFMAALRPWLMPTQQGQAGGRGIVCIEILMQSTGVPFHLIHFRPVPVVKTLWPCEEGVDGIAIRLPRAGSVGHRDLCMVKASGYGAGRYGKIAATCKTAERLIWRWLCSTRNRPAKGTGYKDANNGHEP